MRRPTICFKVRQGRRRGDSSLGRRTSPLRHKQSKPRIRHGQPHLSLYRRRRIVSCIACFVSRRSSASLCAHLRWKICVVVEHFRQFSKPVQDKGRRRAMVHQNRAFPDAHVHKRNFIMRWFKVIIRRILRKQQKAESPSNRKLR